jgi:hypothetical protein
LPASAEQFVVKLDSQIESGSAALRESLKIKEIERLVSEGTNFLVLDAKNEASLEAYFNAKNVTPLSISKVEFVNSPVIGGGEASPQKAREEHQTFVIERPIQGVGSFPLKKKEGISRASNAAIAKMDGRVEWAHSYLTDIGTFCVYRATDENQIAGHAELSGAPLGPITTVEQIIAE